MAKQDPQRKINVSRRTQLDLELDDEKISAIKECLDKGTLSITFSDVDLSVGGRLESAYIYD